jgi:hypothetical protein
MNRFFPIPFYSFCKTVYNNGGLSRSGLLHSFPWLVKTTALEPLRWIELALHNKKINAYQIEQDPIFILGYYRSGTTYLQQMFMRDNRYGYTSLYQTIFPELMLTFEKSMTPLLEKLTKIFKSQNHFHRIPLTWYSAGEEDVAMLSFLNSNATQWGILFPEKALDLFTKYVLFENISAKEVLQWQNKYLYLVKKISIANKSKPLVLKSPPNTARIKQLLKLFPNAKFIYISRHPLDVYSSCKYLWQMIHKKYMLGKYSLTETNKNIIKTYSGLMDRYIRDKQLIPSANLVEISYENFIMQPIKTIENIYLQLGLKKFEYCKEAMKEYSLTQKDYQRLAHCKNESDEVQHQLYPYINYWNDVKNCTHYQPMPYNVS